MNRQVRILRHEIKHWWRIRRLVLSAELAIHGIPHGRGGDAVTVFIDGLWFDVYPWLWQDHKWEWVVDHPHPDHDNDEYSGWEIYRSTGFRFRVSELPARWKEYQATA